MRKISTKFFLLSVVLFFVAICHAEEKSRLITNLETGKQQTIITYGTSLTASGAWVRQLQAVLDSRYPGKAKVINSGKDAMCSKWGVRNLDQQVIEKNPDTVFIEFAINDAFLKYKISLKTARKNLENMIDRILKSNHECEIILMVMNPPIGAHLKRRPNIKSYYQIYRNVAKARKLLLIDHSANWKRIMDEDLTLFKRYIPDGIHPGPEGCQRIITPKIISALGLPQASTESGDIRIEP